MWKNISAAAALVAALMTGLVITTQTAEAYELKGTWRASSASGNTQYSGPWVLSGNVMQYKGSGSACPTERIPVKVTVSGKTITIRGRGCGTTHVCTGTVGGKTIKCERNKFGTPRFTGVVGW